MSETQGQVSRGSVWRTMRGNPLRFLVSAWPWRSLAYLLCGLPAAVVWLVSALVLLIPGIVLTPVVIGAGLLVLVPMSAVAFAAFERRRLRIMDPRPAPSPHRAPPRPGFRAWLRFRLSESATWRELGYGLLALLLAVIEFAVPFVLVVGAVIQVQAPSFVSRGEQIQYGPGITIDHQSEAWPVAVSGVILAILFFYAVTVLAGGQAALARALLVRPVEEELTEVRASRARMADAFEAERRRIERDLHDGAQQRLTGLIMTLGLARLETPSGLLDKAQDDARAALTELRDLVHGIHPSVLTDRGLQAAVQSLVEGSPLPVTVDVELPERPSEDIETAAYFVIAEALANVAKHSGATRAAVSARRARKRLVLEIEDDGTGGAEPGRGTGLQGLVDRVAVHDGTVRLSSPPGGPTILRVEIPCES